MAYIHQDLASGRWFNLSFAEQMANIGSEVERTILWREKNQEWSLKAFDRALELLDLSISDLKKRTGPRLKELLRTREVLVDYFLFDNIYASSDDLWRKYFSPFYFLARK